MRYSARPLSEQHWGHPISIFYTIVDNQADFLVLDKAPGVAVQGDPQAPSVLEHIRRDLGLAQLYPVHRLDMATSGLVVAAKNPDANRILSSAFQHHAITKYYLAITAKKPQKKQGWIIGDMAKTRGGSYRLCRTRDNPSRTRFRSFALEGGKRLFVLWPQTGKTHQLRVALKSLGAPILGDERYGGESADRMYLHAWRLEFTYEGVQCCYVSSPSPGALFAQPELLAMIDEINASGAWRMGAESE